MSGVTVRRRRIAPRRSTLGTIVAAVLSVTVVACAPSAPRAIVAGDDACNYCRMEISDPRFGTQVITSTGKVHVFDSVECLVGYLESIEDMAAPKSVWVADVESAGTWVRAEDAGYLVDGTLRSPMGRVVAFASPAAAATARERHGGTTASWAAIRADSAGVVAHGATARHGAH